MRVAPFAFAAAAAAHPLSASPHKGGYYPSGGEDSLHCGPVGNYFSPSLQDWNNSRTDEFLDSWIKEHQDDIKSNPNGFASAFGQWAMGNDDFTCKDDGNVGCTTDSVCGNAQMNSHGKQIAPAYYVLKSIEGLHSYFRGMSQSYQVAGLLGALETDTWAKTFYKRADGHDADDTEDKSTTALKEIFNAVAVVIGVGAAILTGGVAIAAEAGAAISAAEASEVGIFAGSTAILSAGGLYAANIAMQGMPDSNFAHATEVSNAIGTVVKNSLEGMIQQNNDLMHGDAVNGTGKHIQDYLKGGTFINSTVDKVKAINTMGAMIQGMAVNQLWRENKIFVMGGGKCGDGDGIGQGPQNYSYCDNENRAWYLYFWQANDVLSTTSHKWGWVTMPPGADTLGSGVFPNVTVKDAIASSLNTYKSAGYNYTYDKFVANTESAMQGAWSGDPRNLAASFEGIFSIPVCNVSQAIGSDFQGKEYILQDYGHDSRPVWCGAICDNDAGKTQEFIKAAGMDGFQSPKHLCKGNPGY